MCPTHIDSPKHAQPMMAHFPPNPPFESFGLHGEAVRGTHARGLSVHACDVGLSTRIEDLAIALSACADKTMRML